MTKEASRQCIQEHLGAVANPPWDTFRVDEPIDRVEDGEPCVLFPVTFHWGADSHTMTLVENAHCPITETLDVFRHSIGLLRQSIDRGSYGDFSFLGDEHTVVDVFTVSDDGEKTRLLTSWTPNRPGLS